MPPHYHADFDDDDWPTELWPAMELWQEIRVGFGTIQPHTAEVQRPVLESFARVVGPSTPVSEVKPAHCIRWQAGLIQRRHNRRGPNRPLQESTINRMTSCVRAFFVDAHDLGHIQRNPWRHVPVLPVPESEPRALTDDEVDRILEAANHSGIHAFRNRTIVDLMLWTGLRESEVCRLRADQYDPDRQQLVNVRRSKTRRIEDIFVVGDAEPSLQAWLKHGQRGLVAGPLFPSMKRANNGHMRPDSLASILSKLFAAAGVDGSGHALRHTFLTRLANNGTPIHVVQRAAGHSSLASTQIYVKATDIEVWRAILDLDPDPAADRTEA